MARSSPEGGSESPGGLEVDLGHLSHDGFFLAEEVTHETFTVPSWLTAPNSYAGSERVRAPANVQIVGYNPATKMCLLESAHGPMNRMRLPLHEVEKALGRSVNFNSGHPHVQTHLEQMYPLEHALYYAEVGIGKLRTLVGEQLQRIGNIGLGVKERVMSLLHRKEESVEPSHSQAE